MRRTTHPFARRWNHNSHYYPLLRAAVPDAARRVLDVGCGEGTFCRYLSDPGRLVVGIDVDGRNLSPGAGVSYVVGSAEALGFAEGSFDAVVMTAVLHHVDGNRALREAVRVLAPGGVLQILGIGRYGGPRDLPYELRDVLAHRRQARGRVLWEPPTTRTEPTETWAQTLTLLRRTLPGCSWDRLPLWRYRVAWTKPA